MILVSCVQNFLGPVAVSISGMHLNRWRRYFVVDKSKLSRLMVSNVDGYMFVVDKGIRHRQIDRYIAFLTSSRMVDWSRKSVIYHLSARCACSVPEAERCESMPLPRTLDGYLQPPLPWRYLQNRNRPSPLTTPRSWCHLQHIATPYQADLPHRRIQLALPIVMDNNLLR